METYRIKALIEKSGKTQKELAQELGTTPSNLNNKIKRGSLTQNELRNLAKLCGCVYQEFVEFPDGTRI